MKIMLFARTIHLCLAIVANFLATTGFAADHPDRLNHESLKLMLAHLR